MDRLDLAEPTAQLGKGPRRRVGLLLDVGPLLRHEPATDLAEGADILMVKPALSYLDVIHAVKQKYPEVPLAAYNVSGEFSMVKAAAAQGLIDERQITLELLTSIKRAGADMILTYSAKDVCHWLDSSS